MRLTIFKQFSFEASHVLPHHHGKCARLHGHSWKLTVGVSGPVDKESGFVVDYGMLSELVKAHIINVVDHHHLGYDSIYHNNLDQSLQYGAVFGDSFYPSSENLVMAFVRILQPLVQELGEPGFVWSGDPPGTQPESICEPSIQLEEVSLDETCTCKATWRRDA